MLTATKIRLIYFLVYMSWAIWRVFYNIFLEEQGLNGAQVGTVNAIMQSTIFVVTFWGLVADRKGIRPTMRIVVLVSSLALFCLGYMTNFYVLIVYIPLLTFFTHPLGPLTDAMAIQFSEIEKKSSYGGFRLWGSLGWAIASIIGGILFTKISVSYIFPLTAMFILLVFPLLSTRNKQRTYAANFERGSLKKHLKNKPLVLFLGLMVIYGITCSPVNSYLNLYFVELGAGNNIVGYAYAIMALSELPFFILGTKLLNKIGASKVMLIAMSVMMVRYLIYGLFPSIYLSLAVGLMQGISLAFFLVGAVGYMRELMPSGQHATAQSFIWTGYVGVGQTIGNLLIGFLIDGIGMVGIMKMSIGISLVCIVFTWWYFKKVRRGNLALS